MTNLQQPQAIAISGLNKTVYVADTQAGKVYSYPGLASTAQTTIKTLAQRIAGRFMIASWLL